jgi:sigma-B regulation protein RsbU (phosphoserine phosphatase)
MPEKIFIVDDNMVNRKLLAAILKKEGYELLEAVNGGEAVALALKEQPDLILLDIMMPVKDGYQVCRELKADKRTSSIPIIFLSAKTQVEDKIKGLDLGGSDYVTKPFDRGEVLARVRAHLKIASLTKEVFEANKELVKKQQRLQEDLEAAGGIQRSLLPQKPPDMEIMDVAWRFTPCESIGGDIFNVVRLDEDHWGIYVLDVSGHGVPAALVAVSVSQVLHPQQGLLLKKTIKPPPYYKIVSPSGVLSKLDDEFPMERFDKYFTISYIVLNVKNGSIRYSNAAHPPPMLLHEDGAIDFLDKGGTIVGMGGILPFEEGEMRAQKGDKLFIYTDGIVEYQNRDGELYGEERFEKELKRLRDEPISIIIDSVMDSLMAFGDNNEPQDDITLLGVEFKEEMS